MSAGSDFFRHAGSLPVGAPCYVERPADDELLQLCRGGELAYVLAPRQSGKSSLVLSTQERLRAEGVATAYIDLQTVGVQDVEAESWYLSVLVEVAERLGLGEGVEAWWRDRAALTPVKRFGDFLRQRVLQEVNARRIVVFFDEIELTTDLPFSADDFFTLIRGLTNARASEPELERLSFVLLGVAAPDELIADPKRTPFNVGRGVALEDLSPEAAKALLPGLAAAPEPQAVLDTRGSGSGTWASAFFCRFPPSFEDRS